jgi:hypothetical protein
MTATNNAPVISRIALALLLLAGAGGASADEEYLARRDSITPGAGNAAAHNRAVHTINPWPRYVGNDRINVDGRRIQLGMRRYQANKSIPPRGVSTSSTSFNTLSVTPGQNDAGLGSDYGPSPGASTDNKQP